VFKSEFCALLRKRCSGHFASFFSTSGSYWAKDLTYWQKNRLSAFRSGWVRVLRTTWPGERKALHRRQRRKHNYKNSVSERAEDGGEVRCIIVSLWIEIGRSRPQPAAHEDPRRVTDERTAFAALLLASDFFVSGFEFNYEFIRSSKMVQYSPRCKLCCKLCCYRRMMWCAVGTRSSAHTTKNGLSAIRSFLFLSVPDYFQWWVKGSLVWFWKKTYLYFYSESFSVWVVGRCGLLINTATLLRCPSHFFRFISKSWT